jgi:transposase
LQQTEKLPSSNLLRWRHSHARKTAFSNPDKNLRHSAAKSVNDMAMVKRETGALHPRLQGNGGGHGELKIVSDSIKRRRVEKPCLTVDDLVLELADRCGITIHRVSVWRFLRGLGFTHKKRPARRAIHGPAAICPQSTRGGSSTTARATPA